MELLYGAGGEGVGGGGFNVTTVNKNNGGVEKECGNGQNFY